MPQNTGSILYECDDKLGYSRYARIFLHRILEQHLLSEPEPGAQEDEKHLDCLYAVYGSWGNGKTSFLNISEDIFKTVVEVFNSQNDESLQRLGKEKYSVAWVDLFETWRMENTSNLPVSVYSHIFEMLQETYPGKLMDAEVQRLYIDVLKTVGIVAANLILKILLSVYLPGWGASPELIKALLGVDIPKDHLDVYGKLKALPSDEKIYEEHLSEYKLAKALQKKFDALGELITTKCECDFIVVPIDDLDRCRPESVVNLIFALKHLFMSKYFKFIVAIDKDVLAKSLRHVYKSQQSLEDSIWFLEKIFDDWIELPTPELSEINRAFQFHFVDDNIRTAFLAIINTPSVLNLSVNCRKQLHTLNRLNNYLLDIRSQSLQPDLTDFFIKYLLVVLKTQHPNEMDFVFRNKNIHLNNRLNRNYEGIFCYYIGYYLENGHLVNGAYVNFWHKMGFGERYINEQGGRKVMDHEKIFPPQIYENIIDRKSVLYQLVGCIVEFWITEKKIDDPTKIEVQELTSLISNSLMQIQPYF